MSFLAVNDLICALSPAPIHEPEKHKLELFKTACIVFKFVRSVAEKQLDPIHMLVELYAAGSDEIYAALVVPRHVLPKQMDDVFIRVGIVLTFEKSVTFRHVDARQTFVAFT